MEKLRSFMVGDIITPIGKRRMPAGLDVEEPGVEIVMMVPSVSKGLPREGKEPSSEVARNL